MTDGSGSAHKSFEGSCSWTVQSTETSFADYNFTKACSNTQKGIFDWKCLCVGGWGTITLKRLSVAQMDTRAISGCDGPKVQKEFIFSRAQCLNGNANTLQDCCIWMQGDANRRWSTHERKILYTLGIHHQIPYTPTGYTKNIMRSNEWKLLGFRQGWEIRQSYWHYEKHNRHNSI